jgi:hypothetical protein
MAEETPALVLHLVSGADPLTFPVAPQDRADLEKSLHLLLDHGSVETVRTGDNSTVTVNFAHVAVAYVR